MIRSYSLIDPISGYIPWARKRYNKSTLGGNVELDGSFGFREIEIRIRELQEWLIYHNIAVGWVRFRSF